MSSISAHDGRSQAGRTRIAIALDPSSGDRVPKAHAVPPVMVDLGGHGLTACSFPVDQLTVMLDLDWSDVDPADRCEHCSLVIRATPEY